MILFQPNIRDLGVVPDSDLTMYDHISSVWRWVYLQLCRFGSIRAFLIVDTDAQLARSRIFSIIDYCSSLLVSITSERIARLQNILLTFRNKRHDYVTPLLKKLHWLPVSERIVFKLATLSFSYFDGTLPPYLCCCLSSFSSSRSLCSFS